MSYEAGESYNEKGRALRAGGKLREAIEAHRAGIDAAPDFAPNYCHLGEALMDLGQVLESIAACRQALRIRPDYPEAWFALGFALSARVELDEALECYRKVIALRPEVADAHNNLGSILKMQGDIPGACLAYRAALAANPNYSIAHSNLIMTILYMEGFTPATILEEMKRWDRQHAAPLRAGILPHTNDASPDRRLRIGYVSSDLCDHLVARNILPLLREHEKSAFEVYCYASVRKPDRFTDRCRALVDVWRDILPLDDAMAAQQIRDDEIDVLVDFAGHMGQTRLGIFARKPAPVQVSFGGYPSGTGLATMDYHITDPYLDPPGLTESHYVEELVRLKKSWWCYDLQAMEITESVGPLPAISTGQITFGCLNNFPKISDHNLALWKKLLEETDRSKLMMLTPPGVQGPRVLKAFGAVADRVIFVKTRHRPLYLKLYHGIDIFLDTLPYNGHTTAMDALSMGVPVITRPGEAAVGRAGVSILTNLGLPELIADSDGQYLQIAEQLAGDIPRLAELRKGLRQRMASSVLTDAAGFARDVEGAYRQMWGKWCAGRRPKDP
jgi:protein O-GlcNAc transferase